MSVLETDVTKQFYILLETAWPTVNKILSDNDADRIDWLRAIRSWRVSGTGLLKTPFAVVNWGRKSPAEGGGMCNQEYDWQVSVALVVSLGSTEETENYLMSRMDLLKTALLAATMSVQNFQVMRMPVTDYGATSMANEVLLKGDLPYMAATMDMVLRTGITP